MRWLARVLALALVLAAGAGAAQQAPRRIALVIGNADYNLDGRIDTSEPAKEEAESQGLAPDLANSIHDAQDIRDALLKLGFDVSSYKENADKSEMDALLDAFGRKVAAAGTDAVVLIYYSGHGIQIDNINYLVPVKSKLPALDYAMTTAGEVRDALSAVTTPMDRLRTQLTQRTGPGANIIILDACRANPWTLNGLTDTRPVRGFAGEKWGLDQTLVAYSTDLGEVAYDGAATDRNSPFTAVLKANLAARNVTASDMFNIVSIAVVQQTRTFRDGPQRPWINQVSMPPLCFAGCAPPAPGADLQVLRDLQAARERIAMFEARAGRGLDGADPRGAVTLTGNGDVTKRSLSWQAVALDGNVEYTRIAQYAMSTIREDLEQTGYFQVAGVPDTALRDVNALPDFAGLQARAADYIHLRAALVEQIPAGGFGADARRTT